MRFLVIFLCYVASLAGQTTWSSNGSDSDTQSKITGASSGDTVLLPSSGSFTWSSAVSMPTSKFITLDLNGRTITLSGASGTFEINAHATGVNRVTNGNIVRSGTAYPISTGPFKISDNRGMAGVRCDRITFSSVDNADDKAVIVEIGGTGPGVMDHCDFPSMNAAQEFIHITAWGASNDFGWTNDTGNSLAGSSQIFYIEDCTFVGNSTSFVSWIQGYYGCRVVIRYCQFNQASIDMHGTPGAIGARWWEIYRNTWTKNGSGWLGCNIRAGSGVIHHNTGTTAAEVGLFEEDSGWPADYQVGRGLNQTSDPARIWSNTNITVYEITDPPAVSGMVQENRDYFLSSDDSDARSGYTEYTHPHPLQGATGSMNCTTINATTLRISP